MTQIRRPRDFQRQRLYDAERSIRAWRRKKDYFPTKSRTSRFVYGVCLDPWTVRKFGRPSAPNTFYPGETTDPATGCSYELVLPNWAHFKLVLLHEIAHSLTQWQHGWPNVSNHGPEFASIFLALTYRFMGERDGDQLLNAYEEHTVKYV